MKKSLIITLITVVITLAVCTVAAMYNPPGFGHSVTMVSKDGGMARHPVLLGLNRDNYVILVTGTIIPPYRGGFRISLEGEPEINYKIYSSYPPAFSLGINHFHDFRNNTVTNISPLDKFSLAVLIKPDERIKAESSYELKFYDLKSEKPVLTVPVTFMELVDFNISKKVRRPYPESQGDHSNCVTAGSVVTRK